MRFRDAERLFDILVRLQIYIEAVKVYQAKQFNSVLNEINEEFTKLLSRLKYSTLDALTKAELNKLIVQLRLSQSKIYSRFTEQIEKQLFAFMLASLKVNRIVYASSYVDEDQEMLEEAISDEKADSFLALTLLFPSLFGIAAISRADGGKKLWSHILNEPIPANGALPLAFVKSFCIGSQLNLENMIRKGYANAWTPQQTISEAAAVMNRSVNGYGAVSDTVMQHIAGMVSASVASGLHGKYRWISVIDSATTDICRGRDQHIYEYGKGPLPPAHIRCRSITMPYSTHNMKETFYSFIKRQKARVQNLALGRTTAEMLRAGNLQSKDAIKLSNPSGLSIDDFGESAGEIFAG